MGTETDSRLIYFITNTYKTPEYSGFFVMVQEEFGCDHTFEIR